MCADTGAGCCIGEILNLTVSLNAVDINEEQHAAKVSEE
jgi:hypothetical protein